MSRRARTREAARAAKRYQTGPLGSDDGPEFEVDEQPDDYSQAFTPPEPESTQQENRA